MSTPKDPSPADGRPTPSLTQENPMSDVPGAAAAQPINPILLANEILDLVNGKQVPVEQCTKVLDAILLAYVSTADASGVLELAARVMSDEGVRIYNLLRDRRARLAGSMPPVARAATVIHDTRGPVVVVDASGSLTRANLESLLNRKLH